MRKFALVAALLAAPAAAQTARVTPPPIAVVPTDPAAAYITAGQDEPGYRSWYLAAPGRAQQVRSFNEYLNGAQVGGIVPTWQLFRTATSWQNCGAQPFEIPPTEEWPHIINTLRYIRDYVIPALGPVEPVSAYRNPTLNVCAGGAPESAHKHYSAIDMVPLRPVTREAMMRTLCGDHNRHGAAYQTGLGFYAFIRFHVDSTKYRRWNMDPAVAAECPAIVHPEDAASIGQPLHAAPPITDPLAAQPTPAQPVQPAPGQAPTTPQPAQPH